MEYALGGGGWLSCTKLLAHGFPILFTLDFLAHCSKTTLCNVVCLTHMRPKPVSLSMGPHSGEAEMNHVHTSRG